MVEHILGDVITKEGRQSKFIRDTGRRCPSCGTDSNNRTLFVRTDVDNTAQIECPECGYIENVPSAEVMEIRDIKGRVVKPPKAK